MMSIETVNNLADRKPSSRKKLTRAVAGLAAGVALGLFVGATQASASDDFRDAFEYELGRITAHHVAAVGQLLLFGVPTVHHVYREHGHRHHCGCGHASYRYKCAHRTRHARHKSAHIRPSHRHQNRNRRAAQYRHDDRRHEHRERKYEQASEQRERTKERREDRNVVFQY